MSLPANALVTFSEYEAWRRGALDAAVLEEVERAIGVASDEIEHYCRRVFRRATITDEAHDGNGLSTLYLRRPPITSLIAVKVGGVTLDASACVVPTLATDADAEIDFNDGRLVRVDGTFPVGTRNVLISYSGGFVDVPAPVKQACCELTDLVFLYGRRDMSIAALAGGTGPGEASYDRRALVTAATIPAPIRRRLRPFRIARYVGGVGPESFERLRLRA